MGRFLTQKVRMEQCCQRRYWHTLDNELYKDDDGTIYIVPRHFKTDNFTIPSWVAFLAGSPVDFRVEPSHVHDIQCDFHKAIYVFHTALRRQGAADLPVRQRLYLGGGGARRLVPGAPDRPAGDDHLSAGAAG